MDCNDRADQERRGPARANTNRLLVWLLPTGQASRGPHVEATSRLPGGANFVHRRDSDYKDRRVHALGGKRCARKIGHQVAFTWIRRLAAQ